MRGEQLTLVPGACTGGGSCIGVLFLGLGRRETAPLLAEEPLINDVLESRS